MTLEEFYAKLAQTPRDWQLTHRGRVRMATYMDDKSDCYCYHCPISAVTRNLDDFGAPNIAAETLGLSSGDALAIIAAADRETRDSHYDRRVRARILEACGLDPD